MKNNGKTIYVYENWSSEIPQLIGELNTQFIRGEEIFSFEYDAEWLKSNKIMMLDPGLSFYNGKQYVSGDRKQFGIFMDSEPDRWGRMLMKRREKILAEKEKRETKVLTESDFLLGVEDFSRMGALRFSLEKDGEFVNNSKDLATPPITRLRELEAISLGYENDSLSDTDKWIKMLVAPGSSLGGARPKANVVDLDGSLWIAKFPSKNDELDIGAWEYVVHELAKLCGLNVTEAKLIKYSKMGSTFLSKRFDRKDKNRIHFASCMTLLGKIDGESNECSYLDIANIIKQYGTNPKEDLIELWKRIVFSIAVKNTDDHLRNHGFLLIENGWQLSPMFDVNANPDGMGLSLNIDETDNSLSYDLAISTSKYYGISRENAEKIVEEIKDIVQNNWDKIAKENKISESSIKYMRSAFTA